MTIIRAITMLGVTACCAWSQALSFGVPVFGELSASVGVSLTGTAGANIAALQFALPIPPAGVTMTVTAGAAATAAQKIVACGGTATRYCVVYGMNALTFGDGVVAVVALSATAALTLTETMTVPLAASLTGDTVALAGAAPATLSLSSRCDLNGDHKTDLADVIAAIGQAQGGSLCTTADITGRGKCDVVDIQRIVDAAVNGTCRIGP